MGKTFQKIWTKVHQFLGALSRGQKVRLVILTVFVLAVGVVLYTVASYKPYTVLYSGMTASDAGEVLNVLKDMGVSTKAQGSDTILVPSDQVDEVRMELAAEGYPKSGYNYDIFKEASGLGATDYDKKVYLQFQLQENIRKTILKMNKIQDAVVNINIPDDSSFVLTTDQQASTAAVMLTLKSGQTLSNDEAKAIAELVSKSISGLSIDNVRIIDSNMHLYSVGDSDQTQNVGSQYDLQQNVQNNLQKQVLNMLSPIFGNDGVLVQVGVTLNFDSTVTESITFSPPVEGQTDGLVTSMSQLAEAQQNGGSSASGTAGTSSNSTDTYQSIVNSNNTVYKKVSNEATYAFNQTKTQIESAKGKIEKLSVSVILDSSSNSVDSTDKVKNLVATAIGVSPDNITVEMMPFKNMSNGSSSTATAVYAQQAELLKQAQKAALIRLIVIAGASLFGLVLLLLIIKTMFAGKKAKMNRSKKTTAEVETVTESEPLPQEEEYEFSTKEDGNLQKLNKYIDKSPESVAHLIRTWLAEDTGRQ